MKKIITILTITILFLLNVKIYTQESNSSQKPKKRKFDVPLGEKIPSVKTLKDVLEIRMKMREIERQTIQNDPELKKDFEQLFLLKKQMYEKLNEKLKDNEEYQELRKKLEIINEKIKEKISEERR